MGSAVKEYLVTHNVGVVVAWSTGLLLAAMSGQYVGAVLYYCSWRSVRNWTSICSPERETTLHWRGRRILPGISNVNTSGRLLRASVASCAPVVVKFVS